MTFSRVLVPYIIMHYCYCFLNVLNFLLVDTPLVERFYLSVPQMNLCFSAKLLTRKSYVH